MPTTATYGGSRVVQRGQRKISRSAAFRLRMPAEPLHAWAGDLGFLERTFESFLNAINFGFESAFPPLPIVDFHTH